MTHDQFLLVLIQLSILLVVALVCGEAARRLRQPAVLGEIIGGIVIGPTVLGSLAPGVYAATFPAESGVVVARDAIISIGLLFFLFVAGLEVDVSHLRGRGVRVTATSVAGVVFPFLLGSGAVLLAPRLWDPTGEQNVTLLALFIGTALSISALPVIARILMDLHLMRTELGVLIMAAATVNDLIGWLLFALILSAFLPDGGRPPLVTVAIVVVFVASVFILGRRWGRPALAWVERKQSWSGAILAVTSGLILFAAVVSEWLGVHAVLGAFLIGVVLAPDGEETHGAFAAVQQMTASLFAPLYFASLGLKANFATNFDLALIVVVVLVACVGKIAGAGLGAWMSGMPARNALAVGAGLNARGAMEVILASVALEYALIDRRIFVALVVMAVVTSLLSGPLMAWLERGSEQPAAT